MKDTFGAVTYYAYDGMNRLTAVKSTPDENDAPEAQYVYTTNGLLSDVIQKNNVKSTYTYDGLRLDTLTHKKADNSTIQSFDYNYDANGNISSRVENGTTNDFVYDELNRIETSNQFAEMYDYDSKGNRISFSRNMLIENDNTNLTYDDRDRLTQVATAGGKTVSYKYNGDNLLYERTENGQTTRYYYDGDQVIAEANIVGGNAELKTRYIRGQGLIAAEDANANKAYYSHNGHGDVIELRDETGNTRLNRYTYDIWGNPVIEEENVHNIFRYSGEMWDDTTSLQYLRARWYDPSDGRFISEDTYEGQIDNPLTLNLYTYVHNNPLIYADPTGHWCTSTDGKWSHPGACNSSSSIPSPDIKNSGEEIKKNGEVVGTFIYDSRDDTVTEDETTGLIIEMLFGVGGLVKSLAKAGIKTFTRASSKELSKELDCNCFTAGTKVMTDHGEKPIEEIEKGDSVLAKNEVTGEIAYKEVEWLYRRQVDETYNIYVGNVVITTTDEHPFWINGQGWVRAKDLVIGDELVDSNGSYLKIKDIKIKKENVIVYNFKVKDFHSYFVSNLGVWTHNSCGDEFKAVFKLADNYKLRNYTYKEHILKLHGAGTQVPGKSRFTSSFDIKQGIDDTLKGGDSFILTNTQGRPGFIFIKEYDTPVGYTNGKAVYYLKVVIDETGMVKSAYPTNKIK